MIEKKQELHFQNRNKGFVVEPNDNKKVMESLENPCKWKIDKVYGVQSMKDAM